MTTIHDYEAVSIEDLSDIFPNFSFVDFINQFLLPADHVTNDDVVDVTNQIFLEELRELLQKTPKR